MNPSTPLSQLIISWGGDALLMLIIGLSAGIILATVLCLAFLRDRANWRMERVWKERKNQFVALASHYLLNPIAIIQTALSRLQEEDANLTAEKRLSLYDNIWRGQQYLWILSEQLLLVGQIDEGELELQASVTDLGEIVSAAITAVDPFAREKKVKVRFIDQTKETRETRIDPARLKLAIIAVIDNAIKFSPEEGEVVVELSYADGVFRVTVQDRGIGMSEEVLSHLSERFYRGTALYNYDYEGIGLGLHVAYAIIRMHQGLLTYSSHPSKGTTATITFPNL